MTRDHRNTQRLILVLHLDGIFVVFSFALIVHDKVNSLRADGPVVLVKSCKQAIFVRHLTGVALAPVDNDFVA
jgi:hypothetical protein